jgi:hypothetical protein
MSSNSSQTYYTGDFFNKENDLLAAFGSTPALDVFNFLPFTITSTIGLIMNILAFLVFQDSEFNVRLYAYLRVYCLNNACLCFLNIFNFTFSSIRLFSFANSYWAQVYYNYIYTPVITLNYFFGSVVDIIILLDRIGHFDKRIKPCIKLSPYWICIIAFLGCFLINFPYNILYEPGSITVNLNATITFTLWTSLPTSFASSRLATILVYVVAGLREILVFVIQISLNFVSVFLLKRYLNRKKRIAVHTGLIANPRNASAIRHVSFSAHPNPSAAVTPISNQGRILRSELKATIMVMILLKAFLLVKAV